MAAAAWSWVEKMLHDAQRISAPSCGQRLDQHRGLDRHVQRAGDARALERLGLAELGAQRHQAGHLGLGDLDLLAAEIGERDVLDDVVVMVAHGAESSRRARTRRRPLAAPPAGHNQRASIRHRGRPLDTPPAATRSPGAPEGSHGDHARGRDPARPTGPWSSPATRDYARYALFAATQIARAASRARLRHLPLLRRGAAIRRRAWRRTGSAPAASRPAAPSPALRLDAAADRGRLSAPGAAGGVRGRVPPAALPRRGRLRAGRRLRGAARASISAPRVLGGGAGQHAVAHARPPAGAVPPPAACRRRPTSTPGCC